MNLKGLPSIFPGGKCFYFVRKLTLLTMVFAVLAVFLPLPAAMAAYPTYTANSDLVITGPYDTATAGTTNWGLSQGGVSSREFFTVGQRYRVRQNGSVSRIKIYIGSLNANVTGFYLKIWRKNGSNYDLVGTSDNLASDLTSSTINTIDLATPISGVQEGDYYGYRLETSDSTPYSFYLKSVSNVTTYYLTNVTPGTTNYDWVGSASAAGGVVPIELYMTAPQAVFIGNSIIAGHPAHYNFLETTTTTNIASTIERQFSDFTAYTYQNMGIGSQTTSNIASRFTSDVLNLKPKLVVIEGGVNDIALSVTKSTFIANLTSMLDAAQADSSISTIALLKILPWTNGSTGQMQTRDDWNASMVTLAAGYSKALVVDASSYVGEFRAGGDAGNLWNIQTAYNSDGVHFNTAGHGQIAQAIADAIDDTELTVSGVTATPTSTEATIEWTTGKLASSIINYGLTNSYGSSTSEADTAPRVTSHSETLSNLLACTTYHYRVRSSDAATNEVIGSDSTFTTSGCTGSASVNTQTSSNITTAAGGSLNLLSDSKGISLTVPAAFAGSDANFQIKQLDTAAVINSTSTPAGYSLIDSYLYDLKALTDVSTLLSSFNNAVTVSIAYEASDVSGMVESSLKIYRWDGSSWNQLSDCTVDTGTKNVTCSTTAFSVFGLFGQVTSTSNSSNTSSSSSNTSQPSVPTCSSSKPGSAPDLFQINPKTDSVTLYFSPSSGQRDRYVVSYSTNPGAEQFAFEFMNSNDGVISVDVSALQSNTIYYFKARAGNGCMPGDWSNELSVKTGQRFPSYRWSSLPRIVSTGVTRKTNPASNQTIEVNSTNPPSIPSEPEEQLDKPAEQTVSDNTEQSSPSLLQKVTNFVKGFFGK